jgi:hypothetical protein
VPSSSSTRMPTPLTPPRPRCDSIMTTVPGTKLMSALSGSWRFTRWPRRNAFHWNFSTTRFLPVRWARRVVCAFPDNRGGLRREVRVLDVAVTARRLCSLGVQPRGAVASTEPRARSSQRAERPLMFLNSKNRMTAAMAIRTTSITSPLFGRRCRRPRVRKGLDYNDQCTVEVRY